MDQPPTGDEADVAADDATPTQTVPDVPQSSSVLSSSILTSVPATDEVEASQSQESQPKAAEENTQATPPFEEPQVSAQTESIVKRINDNAANAAAAGTPGWEAAKEQVMKDMQTSDKVSSTPPQDTAVSNQDVTTGSANRSQSAVKADADSIKVTPVSSGRGRGGGRPRGRGRGGGRGGKRKRSEKSDDESEDSEVYSPAVTTTKSGRSVQKPSSFVPPPPSPTTTSKRKRPYRKNPESAVCKVCLRGTSPANNMIVFCDGCNTPYHRYCHHPPIDQAVVDEVDKEWYCQQCEKQRVIPVPEAEVANFISAEGAPPEQRQRYFASLPPGMLITLLMRATSLRPDLPVFAPDFRARISSSTTHPPTAIPSAAKSHAHPQQHPHQQNVAPVPTTFPSAPRSVSQATAGSSHPSTQRSGQHYMHHADQHNYGPDVHPSNYPRPGYGLQRTLPPEQDDLGWLVDDDDRYGVFSHMYQVDPRAANAGMNGGGMGHAQ